MKSETIEIIKLEPEEGKTLTNGTLYSKEVYLGINDSIENWSEIDDELVPEKEVVVESEENEFIEGEI